MIKKETISIIVPVYNSERYIANCIESVLSQTYADFELLIINDGSTDSSGDICDKLAQNDKRIKVYHKENGGVSSARNIGLDLAKGDYIMFLDSDDHFLPESLTLIENKISNYPRLDMLGFVGIRESGQDLGTFTGEDIIIEDFNNYPVSNLRFEVWLHVFKKDLIGGLKFNEEIKYAEDQEFTMKCIAKCQMYVKTNTQICFYCYNPNSAMTQKRSLSGAIDHLIVAKNLINMLYYNELSEGFIIGCIYLMFKSLLNYSYRLPLSQFFEIQRQFRLCFNKDVVKLPFNYKQKIILRIANVSLFPFVVYYRIRNKYA